MSNSPDAEPEPSIGEHRPTLEAASAVPLPARLALRLASRRRRPIIAYHGIDDATREQDPRVLLLPLRTLRLQAKALRDAGFAFATVAELAERSRDESHGYAALTFDDGLMSTFEPLMELADAGILATVYPVVDWIGGRHPRIPDNRKGRMLDAPQLRTLADAGVEIGAHTVTHPDLVASQPKMRARELRESKTALEEIISRPVQTVAYPFGRHDSEVRRAARSAGFAAAVSEADGDVTDRFAIPRAPISRSHNWSVFVFSVAGAWPQIAASLPARAIRSQIRGRRFPACRDKP